MESIVNLLVNGKTLNEIADLYTRLANTGTIALAAGGMLLISSAMLCFFSPSESKSRTGYKILSRIFTFLSIAALCYAAFSLPVSDALMTRIL